MADPTVLVQAHTPLPEVEAIDSWRRQQRDPPTRAKAWRRLAMIGLAAVRGTKAEGKLEIA